MGAANSAEIQQFSTAGFLLGLILGIIGVLIGYLVSKVRDENAFIRGLWFGFIVQFIILLACFFIFFL
jgi:hypothetical protein